LPQRAIFRGAQKPFRPTENDLEAAVDEAIAGCDGDLRATIRALVVANNFLHAQLEHVKDFWCSSAFARGKLRMRDLP
jgi:hypothetical protein